MRNFIIRGTMIAFIGAMGLFGGGNLHVDGLDVSYETNNASAKWRLDPIPCSDKYSFEGCPFGN